MRIHTASAMQLSIWSRRLGFAICLLIVLLGSVLRVTSVRYEYHHPDEVIAVKVAQEVASGSINTNWNLADLPRQFKYPQFNFSSYLLFAGTALRIDQWFGPDSDARSLRVLRVLSAFMGLGVVWLTYLFAKRMSDNRTALCAAALAALNPLLFEDSLFARPESFVTLLTLMAVLLMARDQWPKSDIDRVAAVSFLVGLLVATKISMLALLPLPFLSLKTAKHASWTGELIDYCLDCLKNLRQAHVVVASAAIGFVAGAPCALANPDAFYSGIQVLADQYASEHWPHGLPDEGLPARVAYSIQYFSTTTGPLLVLAIIGGCMTLVRREFFLFGIFAIVAATFLRFSTLPVFFERNLSHVVPFLIIFAARAITDGLKSVFQNGRMALVGLALAAILASFNSLSTTWTLRHRVLSGRSATEASEIRTMLERRLGVHSKRLMWFRDRDQALKALSLHCGPTLIEWITAEDRYSARGIETLKLIDGYKEVGRIPSAFPGVPPSTLQTYFSPTSVFLFKDVPCGISQAKSD